MDELFKRKDFDINDFFMSPLKEIDNNKKKEEQSSNTDFNDDIIRPNFHTKSRLKKNLSFNSEINFTNNFPFNINNNNEYFKIEQNSVLNSLYNTNSDNVDNVENYFIETFEKKDNALINKIINKKENDNISFNEKNKKRKQEIKKTSKSSKKRKININNNEEEEDGNNSNNDNDISSLFKKNTKKKDKSFGDNVSKNYKTLKLKKKHKDISGPRFMKFRNRSNISYTYNSSIVSNYCILNNENPYTEDLSYIMNPKNNFDFNIDNKIAKKSNININKLNLDSEIIMKDDGSNLNINEHLYTFDLSKINDIKESKKIVINLKRALNMMCNFTSFKEGQLEIIKNILDFKSSILILQTGGGKSLCYQLTSYIYKVLNIPNLTLVISPTISLMQDQLFCLPKTLQGALLVNTMPEIEQKRVIQHIINGENDILFITPERLHSKNFQELFKEFPPINFACIDEVHCLSEWSHNFRPSYLYLNHILRNILKVKCIIGLTGSLTKETQTSIMKMLDISEENIISGKLLRNNLRITISKDQDRESALISLLRTPCFHNLNSIIIYCMRQNQCDSLASHLRAYGFQAESYHAGKDRIDREMTQNKFIKGNLRIIVATIAFGLGINKPDVRGVIHFNMPKSIENYTQEIGRSGRDGLTSYCHLFLSSNDYIKMRSLAYSDGVDIICIREMLKKIIIEKNENYNSISSIKRIFLPIDSSEILFDMKKETISTILNYIEIEDKSIKSFLRM